MSSSGWETVTLGEISKNVSYGYTASAQWEPVGPKFLRITDIVGGLNWDTVPYCEIDEPGYKKYRLEIGDIVIARTGATTGTAEIVKEDKQAVFASYLIRFRIDETIASPFFIGHVLKSNSWKEFIKSSLSGSAQPGANAAVLSRYEISLPPLETQHRIADILSALDEKIELNRQTNATLEAIAQVIFKEWFVEFNFPNATGNMIESELGMIPQGWEIRSLYDSATYINGAAYKNIPFSADKSGLPVVKINELKYGITAQTNFTTAELESKYKIENNEILFSWSGSPDTSLDVFVWSGGSAWLNQHIFRVLPHNQFETHYIYYLLKHLKPIIIEIARDKQTTGLGHITVQDMKRMQVLYPPATVLEAFSKMVAPIYDRIFVSELESRTLIELRENLLPKLMSGEIEVTNN